MQNPPNLLRVMLESIHDSVVTTDRLARIQTLNRAAEEMTGWSSAEAAGMVVDEVIRLRSNSGEQALPNPIHAALHNGSRVSSAEQSLLISKDGRRIPVQVLATPAHDASGQVEGCVLVLHDLGEAVQLAERFSYRALHDSLTGLPNRILFVDRLEQAARVADRSNDQMAVIFVGLDHFGRTRAAFGNVLADALLREAAFRLTAALRESDTVCRLGGEEFVILLPGVKSLDDVELLAAKLLVETAQPFALGDHVVQITCSVGISIYPRDASDADTLMRLADGAMHQAKSDGHNRYVFARPEAAQEATQTTQLEDRIRQQG